MSDKSDALAVVDLPEPVVKRGINEGQWRTLCNSLFPGANPKSVLLVWDYCRARNLDPMKKPCHIVPMEIKIGSNYEWRDVILPGIYEYRITAQRTGEYLGHSLPEYGPEIDFNGVKAPEWCAMTIFRFNHAAHAKVEFPVRIYFKEVVATKRDGKPNARWSRAPIQMLTKTTEAAGLREGFPEEIGGEPTAEEMDGQRAIDVGTVSAPALPTAWDRIPEAMRDNVERAFAALKLTEAQRLVQLNTFLTPESVPEEATEQLLAWCREQFKGGKKPAAGNSNKKTPEPEPPPPSEDALTVADIPFGGGK